MDGRRDPYALRLDSGMRDFPPASFHALLGLVSEIDGFNGWWRGRFRPGLLHVEALREAALAEAAAASVRIDWSGLPRPHAERALPPAGKESAEARLGPAIAGYARLLGAVWRDHARIPFSEETILSFHAAILAHASGAQAHRGRYRQGPEAAPPLRRGIESIALRPTDPRLIPEEMAALVRWTAARLDARTFHPLLVIASFLLEFLAISPFADGNGRTSRMLTNLLLLRSGYGYLPYAPLERVVEERKAEYYIALRKSQMSRHLPRQDPGPWGYVFLTALRAHARGLRAAVETTPPETLLSRNQRRVLELLARRREVTNRLVAQELGLSRETAKQVLSRLVAMNAIVRLGSGRAVRYCRNLSPGPGEGAPPLARTAPQAENRGNRGEEG